MKTVPGTEILCEVRMRTGELWASGDETHDSYRMGFLVREEIPLESTTKVVFERVFICRKFRSRWNLLNLLSGEFEVVVMPDQSYIVEGHPERVFIVGRDWVQFPGTNKGMLDWKVRT